MENSELNGKNKILGLRCNVILWSELMISILIHFIRKGNPAPHLKFNILILALP